MNGNLPDNVTDRDIENAFGGHDPIAPYDVEIKYGKSWDLLGTALDMTELIAVVEWLKDNGNDVKVKDAEGKDVEL